MPPKKQKNSDAHTPALPDNDSPHELEFTTSVATWMTLIIDKDPSLPFSAAKCESRSKGLQKRRDLSLFGRDGRPLITGEVKLPYQRDGSTPYNVDVVKDARRKAERADVPYFFTWNVNECVLWNTDTTTGDPATGHQYCAWKVVTITKDTHLALPSTTDTIKRWLGEFLNDLAKIVLGSLKVGYKTPDERFIEALESALTLPIRFTFEELEARYATTREKAALDKWMRDDQGWTITDDQAGLLDNLERAAKFSCRTCRLASLAHYPDSARTRLIRLVAATERGTCGLSHAVGRYRPRRRGCL